MKIAAIDLGTNSFHLIVSQLIDELAIVTVTRSKEMIYLGDKLVNKYLSEEKMKLGLDILKQFKKIANSYNIATDNVLAYATSAIRESFNGHDYAQRIKQHTGINVRIISGHEEAELIYLAVRQSIDLTDKCTLIIDVGGGSVEFIVCNASRIFFIESKPIGILTLFNKFLRSKVLSKEEISGIEQYLKDELKSIISDVSKYKIDMVIATSGTIINIAKICNPQANSMYAKRSLNDVFLPMNGFELSWEKFIDAYEKIIFSPAERYSYQGVDEKRLGVIHFGFVLFKILFEWFNFRSLTISESTLREGMVINHLSSSHSKFKEAIIKSNPKRISVFQLLKRFDFPLVYERHVLMFALKLFDLLSKKMNMEPKYRDFIEYAALLHNIGSVISNSSRHKHAQYIILHSGMQGFTHSELIFLSCICRYYRKSEPKSTHLLFNSLSDNDKNAVRMLSGILRISCALDKTQRQLVSNIFIKLADGNSLEMLLSSTSGIDIELSALQEARDVFFRVFNLNLILTLT